MSAPVPDEPSIVDVDLRAASFETIATFVFDHPPPVSDDDTPWYHEASYELLTEPRSQLAFLRRLLEQPKATLIPYTDPQVNTGFWYMFLAASDQHFLRPLWDATLPWPERAACWAALPTLYSQFFAGRDCDIAFMLPDFLADGRIDHLHDGTLVPGHEPTAGALVLALRQVLGQPDSLSQMAALHGLHHLRAYPGAMNAVEAFLAANHSRSVQVTQYARDVLHGNAI